MIRRFLGWLHEQSIEHGLKIVIFALPSKATKFFGDLDEAAAYVQSIKDRENVYVGVSPLRLIPSGGRGTLKHVGALIGHYADLDYGSQHKKPNLPPTEEDCKKVLQKMGAPVSILVHSGHGLQVYWLFDKPWILDSDPALETARLATRAWNDTLQAVAASLGWTVDAVHDLTRVLRIPGTMNLKYDPVEVKVLRPLGKALPERSEREGYKKFILPPEMFPDQRRTAARRVREVDPIFPEDNPGIMPKITALCENDAKFRLTWERKRTDMNDQSPSGYDLSLTNKMVVAGFTDQEIADGLLQWRRQQGEDETKLQRRDYLMRTISRARSDLEAVIAFESVPSELGMAEPTTITDDQRQELINRLNVGLGLEIEQIIKHGEVGSFYSIKLRNGKVVQLGAIDSLANQTRVRNAVADVVSVFPREVPKGTWEQAKNMMLAAAHMVKNPEFMLSGRMKLYLTTYLDRNQLSDIDVSDVGDLYHVISGNRPFLLRGITYVSLEHFCRFVVLEFGDKVRRDSTAEALRQLGFTRKSVSARDGQSTASRSYWRGVFKPQWTNVLRLGEGEIKDEPAD